MWLLYFVCKLFPFYAFNVSFFLKKMWLLKWSYFYDTVSETPKRSSTIFGKFSIRHKDSIFFVCVPIVSRKNMCSDFSNINLEVGFGAQPIYKLKAARIFLKRNSIK